MVQECFRKVVRMFHKCFKDVENVFLIGSQFSLKEVSRRFYGILMVH